MGGQNEETESYSVSEQNERRERLAKVIKHFMVTSALEMTCNARERKI